MNFISIGHVCLSFKQTLYTNKHVKSSKTTTLPFHYATPAIYSLYHCNKFTLSHLFAGCWLLSAPLGVWFGLPRLHSALRQKVVVFVNVCWGDNTRIYRWLPVSHISTVNRCTPCGVPSCGTYKCVSVCASIWDCVCVCLWCFFYARLRISQILLLNYIESFQSTGIFVASRCILWPLGH